MLHHPIFFLMKIRVALESRDSHWYRQPLLIDATNYVYKCITRQVTTILNLGEFETRFVMQIFRFYCPAAWSRDLMLVMYCMEALSQVTRKEPIINDTGYDPQRK